MVNSNFWRQRRDRIGFATFFSRFYFFSRGSKTNGKNERKSQMTKRIIPFSPRIERSNIRLPPPPFARRRHSHPSYKHVARLLATQPSAVDAIASTVRDGDGNDVNEGGDGAAAAVHFFRCVLMLLLWLKLRPHLSHEYGLTPVW